MAAPISFPLAVSATIVARRSAGSGRRSTSPLGRSWHAAQEPLDRLAHKLKGSSSSFGAARVAALCQQLENTELDDLDTTRLLHQLTQETAHAHSQLAALLDTPPNGGTVPATSTDDW